MELLKKNLGLIIYTLVCLAIAAFVVVGIQRAASAAKELESQVQSQKSFFETVGGYEYALNKNNVDTAEENLEMVEKKFKDLRRWLAQQKNVPPAEPMTSIEALNRLQDTLRKMKSYLEEEKDVYLGSGISQYFSFDSIATSETPPPNYVVPKILRNLRIVQECVRLIGESGVKQMTRIQRPMGLRVQEEDLYTVTPIDLVVIGSVESVQRLVNLFHEQSRFLFFLRNISLQAQDQAPQGMLSGFGTGSGGEPGARGGGYEPRPPGGGAMDPWGGGGPPRMNYAPPPEAMGGGGFAPGPDMDGNRGEGEDGMRRQDYQVQKKDLVVFRSRVLTANLRFDLVEFKVPAQENQ